jgi:hypothetical protein
MFSRPRFSVRGPRARDINICRHILPLHVCSKMCVQIFQYYYMLLLPRMPTPYRAMRV